NNVRDRLLSAQRAADARTPQRGRSLALGRRKSAALAARCRDERGSGQEPFGQRTPQSRRSATHGHERHAKGRRKRLAPRQNQASRLGRGLPRPTTDPVLKCDCPVDKGRRPDMTLHIYKNGPALMRSLWQTLAMTCLSVPEFIPPLSVARRDDERAEFALDQPGE